MRYLKTYENLQEIPKIGDYVIISTNSTIPGIQDFINNTIGEIVYIQEDIIDSIWNSVRPGNIKVKYNNIPNDIIHWFDFKKNTDKLGNRSPINSFFRQFQMNQVVAFSKSKKELEHIIIANKYNL